MSKDYLMTDFAISKKEQSKGVYGKRTTQYRNHQFNLEKPEKFYREDINNLNNDIYNKTEEYWEQNRFEALTKDEKGVYKMLDTLQKVRKFKNLYKLTEILHSGYIHYKNLDFGTIYSFFGQNSVEGFRLRTGVRTYFGPNDSWRLQGHLAYGFKDEKFKYGIAGKWIINQKNRLIVSGGNRRDIEQIGASLNATNNILGRNFASSGLLVLGENDKLTNINLSNIQVEVEPIKNLTFSAGISYKTLESASSKFSLDFYSDLSQKIIKSKLSQSEYNLQVQYTPKRVPIGFGVDRSISKTPFSSIFIAYSQGYKGVLASDFDYKKLQFYYKQPFIIGPLGRSNVVIEMGKTFGQIPLGLMSIIPGNQALLSIPNTFNNLNFYELITDQYATFSWDHDFQGRFFGRIPFMRKLKWRENIGFKSAYGTISNENRMINASQQVYNAPEKIYWEYSAGIGNIFKFLRVDFSWRGNYKEMPDANKFVTKLSFGFFF